MKNEFVLAFNEMLDEKQLPRETIIKALESAMVSAYRKSVVASNAQFVEAKLDAETGAFEIYAEKEVVDDVMDERTEVLLDEARKVNPEAELGDMVVVKTTPKDFGRVAAQTARQVIQQRIRDAERQDQLGYYGKQVGMIVSGVVQSITSEGLTIGLEKKAEGMLYRKDMIRGERFRMHDRVRSLIVQVDDNTRGPQIILSRTHRDFLRRLLEDEVPEIYHGIVEIRSITREPGERAKIAVSGTQQGIDPVGACVGLRGVRIQTIVRELHDEKIDVIEYNADPVIFISKAISPAKVVGVYLGEAKNATVVVPEDQLSLAIGRDGQNARLAAKLTGWRIDIKSVLESAAELLHIYDTDGIIELHDEQGEVFQTITKETLFENEEDAVEKVRGLLAKKADDQNLLSDETDTINRFVDRLQKSISAYIHDSSVTSVLEKLAMQDLTPEEVRNYSVSESGLPKYAANLLANAGLGTFGEIYESMKRDPEEVYRIQGITNKLMGEVSYIVNFVSMYDTAHPDLDAEAVAEAEAEVETEPEQAVDELEEAVIKETPEQDVVEAEVTPVEDITAAPVAEEIVPEEEEEAEELSFDELFNAARPEISNPSYFEEEEDQSGQAAGTGKKKKKKKNVEVEYDDESDETIVHRKHKRGEEDWGW